MIRLKKLEFFNNRKGANFESMDKIVFSPTEVNIITSDDHQDGKTSRRKMILYSLGIAVSFSQPLVIKNYKVVTTWKINGEEYTFERSTKSNKKYIRIEKNFNPDEMFDEKRGDFRGFIDEKDDLERYKIEFFKIFQITFSNFKQIIKSFYVDQDFGFWKNSLEGNVTEKHKFTVQGFISALCPNEEIGDTFAKLKTEQKRRLACSTMINTIRKIQKIPAELNGDNKTILELKNKIYQASKENQTLNWELTEVSKYKNDKKRILTDIENMNFILTIDNKDIPFKKELIKNNVIKENYVLSEIMRLESEISKNSTIIKSANMSISQILKTQKIDTLDYYERIGNKIKGQIDVAEEEVQFLESDKQAINNEIEKIKEEIKEQTGNIVDILQSNTEKMLLKFGSTNTSFSFYDSFRHNGSKSGVEQVYLTISLLYALHVVVKERLHIDFPIIIDAPQQQEMYKTESAIKFAKILFETFEGNQLILFSNTIEETFKDAKITNYHSQKIKKIESI